MKVFKGDFIAKEHLGDPNFFNENGELLLTSIFGNADFRDMIFNAPYLKMVECDCFFQNWEGSADLLNWVEGDVYQKNWEGYAPLNSLFGMLI